MIIKGLVEIIGKVNVESRVILKNAKIKMLKMFQYFN